MNYAECRNDAGLLREYVTERFGSAFLYGSSSEIYFRGIGLCARIAKLIGKGNAETVRQQIVADYISTQ